MVALTDAMFANTKTIKSFKIALDFPVVDIAAAGKIVVTSAGRSTEVNIEVMDLMEIHVGVRVRSVLGLVVAPGSFGVLFSSRRVVIRPQR
jgi:hypothetical protein